MGTQQLQRLLRELDKKFLRPDPARVRMAKTRAKGLCDALDRSSAWMFEVEAIQEHGSLSRGTALRGFDDIDLLVFLDAESLRTLSGSQRTATDTVNRMAKEIKHQRAGLVSQGHVEVRCQDHSIGVTYPGKEIRVDLVPAMRSGNAVLIPEKSSMEWVRTYPAKTAARLDAAVAKDRALKRRIRLAKAWSRARGRNVRLPSFAIETLMVDRALRGQDTRVRSLFEEIADHDNRRRLDLLGRSDDDSQVYVRDPVSKVNLTEELNVGHRRRLVEACRKAADQLDLVESYLEQGSQGPAWTVAEKLFLGSWRDWL